MLILYIYCATVYNFYIYIIFHPHVPLSFHPRFPHRIAMRINAIAKKYDKTFFLLLIFRPR